MPTELTQRLVTRFRWVDPGPQSSHLVSDISGWWRDPAILAALGPALVAPFRTAAPTVVISPAVTGLIVGPLAATALGVGFVPARKADDGRHPPGTTTWAHGEPDYRGRRVTLGVPDAHLRPGDRVLVVDDWLATGAQVRVIHQLCAARGATPVGTAVVVADCPPHVRAELRVRSLLDAEHLPG